MKIRNDTVHSLNRKRKYSCSKRARMKPILRRGSKAVETGEGDGSNGSLKRWRLDRPQVWKLDG